jgi:hypothetical protein
LTESSATHFSLQLAVQAGAGLLQAGSVVHKQTTVVRKPRARRSNTAAAQERDGLVGWALREILPACETARRRLATRRGSLSANRRSGCGPLNEHRHRPRHRPAVGAPWRRSRALPNEGGPWFDPERTMSQIPASAQTLPAP